MLLPAALALVLATESVSKATNRGTAGLRTVYSESLWYAALPTAKLAV